MLKGLILENFKSFSERQYIPLAPLTLIYGANSSGKSSILQSLLLIKQTIEAGRSNDSLFTPKGNLVDLGSFQQTFASTTMFSSGVIALGGRVSHP